MANSEELVAPREQQTAYVRNGVTYVPHYTQGVYVDKKYVGPGYGRHNWDLLEEEELIAAGASPVLLNLWPRAKYSTTAKGL